jgi:hypothetical protein
MIYQLHRRTMPLVTCQGEWLISAVVSQSLTEKEIEVVSEDVVEISAVLAV